MSTLTKVLIVLLTVFSIFLCGIVVTYVATAENFRQQAEERRNKVQSAERSQEAALKELDDVKQLAQREKEQLNAQLHQLDLQAKKLEADLTEARLRITQLNQEVTKQTGLANLAGALAADQTASLKTTQQEVKDLLADQTNRETELKELDESLTERMSIIAQLEEKNRRLTEENQELATRLNQYLQQYGRMAVRPPTTVATRSTPVQPAQPVPAASQQTRTIGLNGRITAVDMKNRLAEISIGSAAGVRQDMTFHIIRGDRWAAKMLILDVSPDKAVGILDLVQVEPQVGDIVTTNL